MEKNQSNSDEMLINFFRFAAERSGVSASIEINEGNTNKKRTKLDIMMAIYNFEAEMAQNLVETPAELLTEDTKEPTKFKKASDCLEQKTQKSDDKNIDGKPF